MNLVIEFAVPYTRVQIRNALANRSASLPAGAVTIVRPVPNEVDLEALPDAEDDLIGALKISGFSTLAELATFLTSLPASINTRIARVNFA